MIWEQHAACRGHDLDLWFSHDYTVQAQAVQICDGCPVARQCLTAARGRREEYGIFGGKLAGGRVAFRSPTCAVDGCDRDRQSRGWCRMHYERWRVHGDPVGTAPVGDGRDLKILAAVADEHGVALGDLTGRGQSPQVVAARRDAILRLRSEGLSLLQIGRLLGRDHTTVLSSLRRSKARGEVAA